MPFTVPFTLPFVLYRRMQTKPVLMLCVELLKQAGVLVSYQGVALCVCLIANLEPVPSISFGFTGPKSWHFCKRQVYRRLC